MEIEATVPLTEILLVVSLTRSAGWLEIG